jgi:hypothetical protein
MALVVAPLCAAFRVSGPRALTLDLGPGDGPYVSGFTPEWEVDDKVGTHWTTYQAAATLPLEVRGPLRLTARYARVLPQTAVVDVLVAGRPAGRFTCRGGVWEERTFDIGRVDAAPARVEVRVDSHDRRNLGLKLDWLRLEAGGTRLQGGSRLRAAATIALIAFLLLAVGFPPGQAAAGTAPAAAGLTVLLLRDAWLTHRLLTLVPESLAASALLVLAVRALPRLRSGLPPAMRLAAALAAYAFLLRAGAVNHPAFYYPDLLVHARLVEVVRAAGPDFLRAPSTYLWGDGGSVGPQGRGPSGLWLKDVGGRAYGLPYSLAFHAPFAPFEATLDRRIGWLKVWGAALSVVPILALGALARRWGLPLVGLGAMLVVPTYLSRLTLALLPALFGHATEMVFLCWLARRLDVRPSVRAVAAGALLLAACQLAYVSASASLLVMVLAAGLARVKDPEGRARARAFVIMLAGASALSVALYYRDFLAPWLSGGAGLAGVKGAGSGSGFESPLLRVQAVFGTTFVLAAAAGAVWLRRAVPARTLVGAWALVGALLLAARSVVPVMRFAHEELWLAPLVSLAAGQAVAWLWASGGWRRGGAVALGFALAVEGTLLQWRAFAAQLHPSG